MGGCVAVTSRVGEGSTFTARLPVEIAELARPVARQGHVAAAVVLRIAAPSLRTALAGRLTANGFMVTDSDDAGERPDWVVDAVDLLAMGTWPPGAERVLALGGLGDGAADEGEGLPDEILRWPVTHRDWQPAPAVLAGGGRFAGSPQRDGAAEVLPRFPQARVLVADDSAVNREVALEALARCGVTDVVTVEDGAQAVEAAAAGRFDLILMNGSMPVPDGFAATRAIRLAEAASGPRTPIVALTAHVQGEAMEAAQAAGMAGTHGQLVSRHRGHGLRDRADLAVRRPVHAGLRGGRLLPGCALIPCLLVPAAYRAKIVVSFSMSVPLSGFAGLPISGATLDLDGAFGIHGWQWLFIVAGPPAVLAGILTFAYSLNCSQQASSLSTSERDWHVTTREAEEDANGSRAHASLWRSLGDRRILPLGVVSAEIPGTRYGLKIHSRTTRRSFARTVAGVDTTGVRWG